MKRTENPSAVRSRIALIYALATLMKEKKFNDICIQEITDAANLSRQTFYTNFTSKEDILKYALEKLFEMLNEQESHESFPKFWESYFQFWDQYTIVLPVLFQHSLDMIFLEKNRTYFLDKEAWLQSQLHVKDYELPYMSEYLCSMTYAMLRVWVNKENRRSVKDICASSRRFHEAISKMREQAIQYDPCKA